MVSSGHSYLYDQFKLNSSLKLVLLGLSPICGRLRGICAHTHRIKSDTYSRPWRAQGVNPWSKFTPMQSLSFCVPPVFFSQDTRLVTSWKLCRKFPSSFLLRNGNFRRDKPLVVPNLRGQRCVCHICVSRLGQSYIHQQRCTAIVLDFRYTAQTVYGERRFDCRI